MKEKSIFSFFVFWLDLTELLSMKVSVLVFLFVNNYMMNVTMKDSIFCLILYYNVFMLYCMYQTLVYVL